MPRQDPADTPRQAREHLAAIAAEMAVSREDRRNLGHRGTLKELLIDVVSLLRAFQHERERAGWMEKLQETSVLIAFGALCVGLMFASTSRGEFDWLDDHRVLLRTLSVGLSAIYIGVVVERMGIVAMIWRYHIAKFIASLAVSVLVVYSAGAASSIINGIFRIDAGAFPYTRAMLTGWLAFSMAAKPLLWLVGLLAIAHAGWVVLWLATTFFPDTFAAERREFPWPSALLIVVSLIVLGNAGGWFYRSLADQRLPTKVYQLARTLDFNARHACTNLPEGTPVVYIGPDQRQVLVDVRPGPTPSFGEFINQPVNDEDAPREKFPVRPCAMVAPDAR